MKINKWTLGLAAAGVVSLGSVAQAEEASEHVMTAVSGTQISGYVSTTAMWTPGTGSRTAAAAGALPGRTFHDAGNKQDGFNLDVIDITLSKPLDESEWSAGYKAELWFGTDAQGLGNTLGGFAAADQLAVRQAYVELRAPVGNGLDLKMGVFDSIIGYEGLNHDANLNFGRNYGFFIQPFTHTGLLASYQVSDFLSVRAGVANNGLNTINGNAPGVAQPVESDKSYMAAFTLTAPDDWGFLSGASLTAGVLDTTLSGAPVGVVTPFAGNGSDVMNYYVGVTLPLPIEGWSVGAGYDYRGQSSSAANANNSNYANAVALYLSAGLTEKLKVNLRADYTTATTGTYYATAAQHNNQLFALTTTVDYSLWENVISRLEVRWDHQLGGGRLDANGGVNGGAFNGAGQSDGDKNALTVALNLIYKF